MTIQEHLISNDFRLTRSGKMICPDNALDTLSLLVCFQYRLLGPLLFHMRGNIREKPGFFHEMHSFTEADRQSLLDFCWIMKANGLLLKYYNDRNQGAIVGTARVDDRALDFLTGGWLERAVRVGILGFLNLDGPEVEIATNVCVERPPDRNGVRRQFELDVLLRVDHALYWWEAKCGQFNNEQITRYTEVARELGLAKSHCFLVLGKQDMQPQHFVQIEQKSGFQVFPPGHIPRKIEAIERNHQSRD